MLNSIVKVTPLFSKLFSNKVSIGVTDLEKFIVYIPGETLNFNIKPGDLIQDHTMKKAIETGKDFVDLVPAEVFGIPFRGFTFPLKENGEIVGCIGIAKNLELEEKLKTITNQLSESMNQIVASTEEISATAENTVDRTGQITDEAKKVNEYISNTNEILKIVKYVADRSRLLGLNAAIEASRAGEVGLGFTVVAEEIRKLADKSQESVQEVYQIINQLESSVKLLVNFITEINSVTENQAAAIEEVSASTEEINAVVEELNHLTNKL